MEIERKYLIKDLPELGTYEHKHITQAYLCTNPVIRIREENDNYYLTYKGKGLLEREEYNLPLNKEAFNHLLPKADGKVISKTRFYIPYDCFTIELDVFEGIHAPLIMAEVEFSSVQEANDFTPPSWFGKEVTDDPAYQNSNMI